MFSAREAAGKSEIANLTIVENDILMATERGHFSVNDVDAATDTIKILTDKGYKIKLHEGGRVKISWESQKDEGGNDIEKFRVPYVLLKEICSHEEKNPQDKVEVITMGGNHIIARRIILESGRVSYDFTVNENED